MIIIRRGTLITCPRCNSEIAIVTDDIEEGQRVTTDHLKSLTHLVYIGTQTHCPEDMEMWFYDGRIHTQRGWVQTGQASRRHRY